MPDIRACFRQFYKTYNRDTVKKAYGAVNASFRLFQRYKAISFEAEIRMKNDCLAMRISADDALPEELMTVIGFFFENYNDKRNCVWTKDARHIKYFFMSGIDEVRCYGGKIVLNMEESGIQKIVRLLTDDKKDADDNLYFRLCERFQCLEEISWLAFYAKCKTEIETEEENARIDKVTRMELPPGWVNPFLKDKRADGVFAKNAEEGLWISMDRLGNVDIAYIAQITGMSLKNVITELGGAIYQNPDHWGECFYSGWETAEEYLSGRVVEKLKSARNADEKYKGYFSNNVKALETVIPQKISANEIYVTLGSPWLPEDIIDEFIRYLLGECCALQKKGTISCYTEHDAERAIWKIPFKSGYQGQFKSDHTYGTERMGALQIIEKTLNMRSVVITDEIACPTVKSGKRRVINHQETMLAAEKQQTIIKTFQSWVWQNKNRRERLENIYYKTYASSVARHYDGSFLTFPEMSEKENLFDYQRNAVARIMFSQNTLLAHEVGAGKTFVMIAAGMKMRQIGISQKNMFVVPNSIVGQWKSLFQRLYPKASILCITPSCFTPGKRKAAIDDIKNGGYDGIIIAYSCFGEIPVGKSAAGDSCDTVCFEDLGIKTLFVDEAHHYKNLSIKTKISNVLGISVGGSAKCNDMYEKVRIVQMQNSGRGVVFATGTPITNSLTDAYVMQKYLQFNMLSLFKLQSFDAWVGMFAEKVTEVEIGVDTSKFKMATRFLKFHNLPELGNLLAMIADFHGVSEENEIPDFAGYTDDKIVKTAELRLYLNDIAKRADRVRGRRVDPKTDNMLKITTDGRKAALDMRLVDANAAFAYESKAAHCAENVMNIYKKTKGQKSTQIIFCDTSTPKPAFNLYDEIKRLLVKMGAAEDEIAYVHDAESEKAREEMFLAVQMGKIRILIGSTFKLGLGVNVQNKLIALHHLDVPWRPADMIQREGRILRRGNENKTVTIYRYITEGSFDAYSWQLLESKQRVITSILSGKADRRDCGELDDSVLNYAEVKAIAIGNPLLKERVECANALSKYTAMQRKIDESRIKLKMELIEMPDKIKRQEELIRKAKLDRDFSKSNPIVYQREKRKELRETLYRLLMENELCEKESKAISYRGFEVILPANMIKHKPFLYIENNGRYYIELGNAKNGLLVRIDHFIDRFEKYVRMLENHLENMQKRHHDIAEALERNENYSDKIQSLKDRIKEIDKEFGVKNE